MFEVTASYKPKENKPYNYLDNQLFEIVEQKHFAGSGFGYGQRDLIFQFDTEKEAKTARKTLLKHKPFKISDVCDMAEFEEDDDFE